MITVDELMHEAFDRKRDPRSDAYKTGVRAYLTYRLEHTDLPLPYSKGTAECDAYWSGLEEGKLIYKNLMIQSDPRKEPQP